MKSDPFNVILNEFLIEEGIVITERSINKNILTARQAAAYLKLHPVSLARWRMLGTGPKYIKMARYIRYRLDDLNEFIRSFPVFNQ